jgi:NADPH2:quinone reductase
VDTVMRRGVSPLGQPPLPGSPHGDVVGTVAAAGGEVSAALVGQRVVALVSPDAYADYVLADAGWLAPVAASGELAALPASSLYAPRSVTGFRLLSWRLARPGQARREMTEVAELAAEGRLQP